MRKRTAIGILILTVFSLGVGIAVWNSRADTRADMRILAGYGSALPKDFVRPPQEWLLDYAEYEEAVAALRALEKKYGIKVKRDQINGMAGRLRSSIREGYEFDEETRAWKPRAISVAPPQEVPKK